MSYLNNCVKMMVENRASDLYMIAGEPIIARIHGSLRRLNEEKILEDEDVINVASSIFTEEQLKALDEEKNVDFAIEIGSEEEGGPWRLCGNAYEQKNGLNIVFRLIPNKVPTLEELNLPSTLANLTKYRQGLILCTGQAGCGKTATIAALLDIVNHTTPAHIITVEDPIEYKFTSDLALINQRQVGRDVESFSLALKGALREDPDIIFVGELRDLETISLAVTAAETGHLVFATLHTNSAAKAVDRLIDSFPIEQQAQIRIMISESLRGVIAQQLIPRKDGNGRVVAVEVLANNTNVSNLIRDGKTYQIGMTMQTGKKEGMCLMDDSIMSLFKKGLISKEEAEGRSIHRDAYSDL
ncbi:PilT/PilU family type 4a pilus ATPase [bacterium]|nr:PilT/PilU family type 4a pilus ATPase [bacterium]